MQTLSFSQWLEWSNLQKKILVTFDFDETLTRWGQSEDGHWIQLPNEKNIKNYLQEHYAAGDICSIVTYRNPSLSKDPRFKLYSKIEPYLHAWGLDDAITNVVYTRLSPKPKYIFTLAKHLRIPFSTHYDDDSTHTNAVNHSPELREISANPGMIMGVHLPYTGPRPPAPMITPAGMVGQK